MLFISILLSVWFVLWLVYVVYIKDLGGIIVTWLSMFSEDDEEEQNIDDLIDESGRGVYHLNCTSCGHDWWSVEPNVNFCPHCGKKFE